MAQEEGMMKAEGRETSEMLAAISSIYCINEDKSVFSLRANMYYKRSETNSSESWGKIILCLC